MPADLLDIAPSFLDVSKITFRQKRIDLYQLKDKNKIRKTIYENGFGARLFHTR